MSTVVDTSVAWATSTPSCAVRRRHRVERQLWSTGPAVTSAGVFAADPGGTAGRRLAARQVYDDATGAPTCGAQTPTTCGSRRDRPVST
jgi:hypothetical protein